VCAAAAADRRCRGISPPRIPKLVGRASQRNCNPSCILRIEETRDMQRQRRRTTNRANGARFVNIIGRCRKGSVRPFQREARGQILGLGYRLLPPVRLVLSSSSRKSRKPDRNGSMFRRPATLRIRRARIPRQRLSASSPVAKAADMRVPRCRSTMPHRAVKHGG